MQLQEAVKRYPAFRNYLDNKGLFTDEPFHVISMGNYYFIMLTWDIAQAFSIQAHDDRCIELQRGDTRYFKTFDAASNVLRQIGQDRVQVML